MKILEDPLFKEFVITRQLKKSTIETYLQAWGQYIPITGKKNITEIISEAEQEEDQGVKRRKRKIRKYFIQYIQTLEKKGLAPGTIRLYLSRIKAIYNEYDIDPPKIRYARNTQENRSFEELITFDELKEVISIVKPREKALILLHMTSGMGASEVRNLRVHDFETAINDDVLNTDYTELEKKILEENIIGTWKIRRIKTGMPYVTFTTPEANIQLIKYLKYRKSLNIPIQNPEDYIFVTNTGRKLTSEYYAMIFSRINDYMGFGRLRSGGRRFTSHKLRKLFATLLYQKGMDKLMVDWLMGHKVDSVTDAYFKANIDHLRGEYEKRMHVLMFEKTVVRHVSSEEVREIVRELEEREREIRELRESQERLRKWVKKTEKLYDLLMSDPSFLKKFI